MAKGLKVIYAVPEASSKGGMTSIVQMFYAAGLFSDKNRIHFNTSFTGKGKLSRFIESFTKRIQFGKIIISSKADIVFIMSSSNWGFYDKIIYAIIARLLGTKVVLNPVGGYFKNFYLSNVVNKTLVRLALKVPHRTVISAGLWYEFFASEFPTTSLTQIPNPVNTAAFDKATPGRNGALQVIFIGHLIREKGILELIEIIKTVLIKSKAFSFVIIGKGNLSATMATELKTYVDTGQVQLLGFVGESEKIKALSSSDVFLFTSHFEVLPISILEAMASGLPVISTNVGGIPEAVIHGENGFLFDINSPDKMAECLLHLQTRRDLLTDMGASSYRICKENYDLQSVLSRHNSLFQTL